LLCQLHAARPDRPLPASRGTLYRDFIELLRQRQQAPGHSGVRSQASRSLEPYGNHALARVEHVLDRLPQLIEHLAAKQHAGDTRHAVDILAAQPDAATPSNVPEAAWRNFLEASLRRSGLVSVSAGE